MPVSATTPGRAHSRDGEHVRVAFRTDQGVGTQKVIFEAQWPACACPGRRFADILTDADARLGVDTTRYVFIVRDFHSMFLAGLPAHGPPYLGGGGFTLSRRQHFIERQRKGAYQNRLVKQLERMGYDVTLTEKAA